MLARNGTQSIRNIFGFATAMGTTEVLHARGVDLEGNP